MTRNFYPRFSAGITSVPNFVYNYFCLKARTFPRIKNPSGWSKSQNTMRFYKNVFSSSTSLSRNYYLNNFRRSTYKTLPSLAFQLQGVIYILSILFFRNLVTFCSKIFISQLVFYFHQYDLLILHLSRSMGTKDFAAVLLELKKWRKKTIEKKKKPEM